MFCYFLNDALLKKSSRFKTEPIKDMRLYSFEKLRPEAGKRGHRPVRYSCLTTNHEHEDDVLQYSFYWKLLFRFSLHRQGFKFASIKQEVNVLYYG